MNSSGCFFGNNSAKIMNRFIFYSCLTLSYYFLLPLGSIELIYTNAQYFYNVLPFLFFWVLLFFVILVFYGASIFPVIFSLYLIIEFLSLLFLQIIYLNACLIRSNFVFHREHSTHLLFLMLIYISSCSVISAQYF